jgi:hypothetical protein
MDKKNEKFAAEVEARKTLAGIMGGLFVLITLYFTWANLNTSQDTLRLSQEGQVTERFAKAIELLGNRDKNLEVRIGGIYALERISVDYPQDYWPIMEVLTTFVRSQAPRRDDDESKAESVRASKQIRKPSGSHPKTNTDDLTDQSTSAESAVAPQIDKAVEAIMIVIARRKRSYENDNDLRLNLTQTDLRDLFQDLPLNSANFAGVIFRNARLDEAHLNNANLESANLDGAVLVTTHLEKANLARASLVGADLRGAILRDARLEGADLQGAKLNGAHLEGADLQSVTNLHWDQLKLASLDATTRLPQNVVEERSREEK